VEAGRTARLDLRNETAQLYRVSDNEERIEALILEPQDSTEVFYELPEGAGEYTLRCTAADGTASSVTLRAGAGAESEDEGAATATAGQAETTVAVTLAEYSVTASETEIPAGRIRFVATNTSARMSHELNVLRLATDRSFERLAGAGPIARQDGASLEVELEPGTYRLACQIVAGEADNAVDHYQQGMWTDVTIR
jgi:uncharacterized cupredoxin-like copper-binding protein